MERIRFGDSGHLQDFRARCWLAVDAHGMLLVLRISPWSSTRVIPQLPLWAPWGPLPRSS